VPRSTRLWPSCARWRVAGGDLLAETAGVMVGAWSVRVDTGDHLLAAGLLVLAGADHDQIARWVEIGRERVMTPRHSI
jgi:hypothetical protein